VRKRRQNVIPKKKPGFSGCTVSVRGIPSKEGNAAEMAEIPQTPIVPITVTERFSRLCITEEDVPA
jgi:hypothetical protein